MGERKVLNRYIPPDFNPAIIPRMHIRERGKLMEVRMMLPFSMRCDTCGEYLYRGKKFNSRTERLRDDDYLGIKKFRFYIKCSVCSAEITFKTDPKNSDYECESGASRNFEIWRDSEEAMLASAREREEEEKIDPMKALENRTMDSKIEMDVLDALDQIKAMNQRHERVDTNKVLSSIHSKHATEPAVKLNANGLTDADEELVKSIKFKSKEGSSTAAGGGASGGSLISDALKSIHHQNASAEMVAPTQLPTKRTAAGGGEGMKNSAAQETRTVVVKKKRKIEETETVSSGGSDAKSAAEVKVTETVKTAASLPTAPSAVPTSTSTTGTSALGMCDYDSD